MPINETLVTNISEEELADISNRRFTQIEDVEDVGVIGHKKAGIAIFILGHARDLARRLTEAAEIHETHEKARELVRAAIADKAGGGS